ncbi:MAG: cytosolic protein [Bacteroidetes bacterium]|nr:cytosolic protein [Bacteroidota bacterium]
MKTNSNTPEKLSKEQNATLIIDFFHRIMMHHAMWFVQVQQRLGTEKAFTALDDVYKKSLEIQMKRISKTLGFEMKNGIPALMLDMPDEMLDTLRENIAANWLANDGLWFQAVEFADNMNDAKHCNDTCWAEFSPFEAWSVKRILNLPQQSGLEGLKKALQYRLYAFINKQSITDETPNSFVFRMDDCRVQSARKRKGLADYPCKSAGIVEYSTFAAAIDPRIKTECICCPPDKHPDEYYCAWKFSI